MLYSDAASKNKGPQKIMPIKIKRMDIIILKFISVLLLYYTISCAATVLIWEELFGMDQPEQNPQDSNMQAFAFECSIISSHSYLPEGLPWPSYLPSSLLAMPGHRADTLSRGDWECNWNVLEKPWGS